MLTAIRLANFKAFGKRQQVSFAPITLLFGPNSAGKSSIIHSLALLHEAFRTGSLDISKTAIGGDAIDLGGFRQYVYRRNANARVEWSADIPSASIALFPDALLADTKVASVTITFGVQVDDVGNPVRGARVHVIRYDLDVDGISFVRLSGRPDGTLRIDRLNVENPLTTKLVTALVQSFTTAQTLNDVELEQLHAGIRDIVSRLRVSSGTLFPTGIEREANSVADFPEEMIPISRGTRYADLIKALEMFLPRVLNSIIVQVTNQLESSMLRLEYLGPLRTYPGRHFAFDNKDDLNWRAGGGAAWDILRRDEVTRNEINTWLRSDFLPTPYEVRVRKLVSTTDLQRTILQDLEKSREPTRLQEDSERDLESSALEADLDEATDVERFANRLDDTLSDPFSLDPINELIMVDRRTETFVSHRDVGIGISQVLPVLVAAIAFREKTIAIEQPEIHLHPALQSELADVFLKSALGQNRNQFILETHSEHIILRLLRRIRESHENRLPSGMPVVSPQDVSVVYVEPTAEGARVLPLSISVDGDFQEPWPGGFFAERASELF